MTTLQLSPVSDASVWTGADLQADQRWELSLTDTQQADLLAALASVERRGLALAEITAADFPLPTMAGLLTAVAHEVQHGRGVAVVHGFPVEGQTLDQLDKLYWGMCTHLGTGVTQNSDSTLIHYVTEGRLRPSQGSRGVGLPSESTLHVDLTDCVSLLCVRQAPDDPPSWLASSTHIFNEFLRRRPDLLEPLLEGFEWDRLGEHGPGETPTSGYRVPVFSVVAGADGRPLVSCRYNRYWMAAADRRQDRHNSPNQRAALDLFDEIARESRLELPFAPGDVQFVNNYTVLHGRAAHEHQTEEDQMRLLLRIWIDFPEARPTVDEAIVRYGIVRHGRLGWTAAQLQAGLVDSGRPRRADGAPALA